MQQTAVENSIRARHVDRDISWLSFNERVLMEAEKQNIPLLERLKFLAIYSSNLDEFYRVRIPSIMALSEVNDSAGDLLSCIKEIVVDHQNRYGEVLLHSIIPALSKHGIEFLYNEDVPESISTQVAHIFFTRVAGCLHLVRLTDESNFFPENNKIYFAITGNHSDDLFVVNIPSDSLPRFHEVTIADKTYVIMIDDIIRQHVPALFREMQLEGIYAFKITRDAELNLKDEIPGRMTTQLERLLARRDYGMPTRLLYDSTMPEEILKKLVKTLKLKHAIRVAGGRYHNLRDFLSFPLRDARFCYPEHRPIPLDVEVGESVYALMDRRDLIVHTPYNSYDLILRFFNESAIDPAVEKIYVTLYRIAGDSAIAQALMTAARNGKKVTVLVELKARFDEANNIRWAKRMKAAGVRICYSSPSIKVHAKIALVKRGSANSKAHFYGLLSTGNFNENTARLYTDHILFTSHPAMLQEVQSVFKILVKGTKPLILLDKSFAHLIVAPFNIIERFFDLIEREIVNARQGRRASIIVKLNNLEEETLIDKLYEASSAGVKIKLIVRSICRIIPGVQGLSENISVRRIVDRYLEHARVFIFHNGGEEEVYCGSSDWMNRNIYHRVEVCFPLYDRSIKEQIKSIIDLQCADTAQAVALSFASTRSEHDDMLWARQAPALRQAQGPNTLRQAQGPIIGGEGPALVHSGRPILVNVPLTPSRKRKVRSQEEIYKMIALRQAQAPRILSTDSSTSP